MWASIPAGGVSWWPDGWLGWLLPTSFMAMTLNWYLTYGAKDSTTVVSFPWTRVSSSHLQAPSVPSNSTIYSGSGNTEAHIRKTKVFGVHLGLYTILNVLKDVLWIIHSCTDGFNINSGERSYPKSSLPLILLLWSSPASRQSNICSVFLTSEGFWWIRTSD